ncbi:MAG: hypothetical protein AAGF25_15010 [Pseudomonadota bacterium]
MRLYRLTFLVLLLLGILSGPSHAQGLSAADIDLNDDDIYQASAKALSVLLVVAILIENALALIFNWRIFRAYFNLDALKTIISFVVSLVVVKQFELDVFGSLLLVYGDAGLRETSELTTEVLSAMIIAGGSAGVNNVMRALGYRRPVSIDDDLPPADRAWVAINVKRGSGSDSLQIAITPQCGDASNQPAIAGTVFANRPKLMSLLTTNNNRFPRNGGYEVEPGKSYRIAVIGTDKQGKRKAVNVSEDPMRFAPRAIVDLDVTF